MALERTTPGHQLPCGRRVEDILGELDGGVLSGHTRGCPHCTTACRGIDALNEATRVLIDDPADPRPGLFDRIMNAVRVEVFHGESLALPTAHGHADISIRAVASLLRFVADTVPGARARHCRIEVDDDRPGSARIDMSLSVRYGTAIEPLLEQVRGQLVAAVSGQIGLRVHTIDLDVVDLWDE